MARQKTERDENENYQHGELMKIIPSALVSFSSSVKCQMSSEETESLLIAGKTICSEIKGCYAMHSLLKVN